MVQMHLLYKLFGLIIRLELKLHSAILEPYIYHYSSKLAVGYYMLLTGSLAHTYHPHLTALGCRT